MRRAEDQGAVPGVRGEMTEFVCKKCPKNNREDCGPFDSKWETFLRYESFHRGCPNWQVKEETLQEMAQAFLVENGPGMIDAIKERAHMLDEDLFENIRKVLSRVVTDEAENIVQIAITILSAYTSHPQNLRILAPSGEGKTYLVNNVSALFPQDNIVVLSNATPQSFKYMASKKIVESSPGVWEDYDEVVAPLWARAETIQTKSGPVQKLSIEEKKQLAEIDANTYLLMDFTNKTIIFLDNQSFMLWESLKTTLSHDREYNKSLMVNKSSQGKAGTSKVVYKGWPAVIYCSAKDEMSEDKTDEINTRFNTISIKGTPDKYKKMLNIQTMKANLPGMIYSSKVISEPEIERVKLHIELVIEEMRKYYKLKGPICNFYGEHIADLFKHDAGYRARQLANFNANIQVITLAYAKQRPKLVMGENLYPITLKRDVLLANKLSHEPNPVPLTKLQFFNQHIRPALLREGREVSTIYGNIRGLTANELVDKIKQNMLGVMLDTKKLRENWLELFVDHGYLEDIQNPDQKNQYLYYLTPRYIKEEAVIESSVIAASAGDESCL
ncbi:MAG: hypothetical protein LV468_03950, partial [Candidatus Nitrosotenuis sp.]|nr:hypothetical protein [Candidatus Nitrosotenuis sp.]